MDIREKLVELLNKANSACVGTDCFEGCKFYMENDCLYKLMADHLISNGVTVQEWTSVKDGLPEPKKLVLCIWKDINGVHYGFSRYQHDNVWYVSNEGMPEVTHWMALPKKPQPPKGD